MPLATTMNLIPILPIRNHTRLIKIIVYESNCIAWNLIYFLAVNAGYSLVMCMVDQLRDSSPLCKRNIVKIVGPKN